MADTHGQYVGGLYPGCDYADGRDPYDDIADHLGCSVDHVWRGFSALSVPEWSTPEHLDRLKKGAHALNDLEKHLARAVAAMKTLHPEDRDSLLHAGCPSIWQMDSFLIQIRQDSEFHMGFLKQYDRKGGRNPAAYEVAEGVRKTFRLLGRKVTYGSSPIDGEPSTDFGKAVQFALGAFGVVADWHRPALEAHNHHARIVERWKRMRSAQTG